MQLLTDTALLTCGSNRITLRDFRVAGATAWSRELPGWFAVDAYIVHQGTRGAVLDPQHNPYVVSSCVSRSKTNAYGEYPILLHIYDHRMMGARPNPISLFHPSEDTGCALVHDDNTVTASTMDAAGPVVAVREEDYYGYSIFRINAFKWAQTGGEPDHDFMSGSRALLALYNFRLSSNGSHVLVWHKKVGMCAHGTDYGEGAAYESIDNDQWMEPWELFPPFDNTVKRVSSVDMMDTLVVAVGSTRKVWFHEFGVLDEAVW